MQKVITLASEPEISGFASIVGKKEAEGPLKDYFDIVKEDTSLACETWEQAESLLQQNALYAAMKKAKVTESDLDVIFAGDLLNQCTASGYSMKNVSVPFAGVYGACSTMALSAILAALCVDSGAADRAGAVTSSHFLRRFRRRRQSRRRHFVAFLLGRAAVPQADRIRRSAHPDVAMDCHRRRMPYF